VEIADKLRKYPVLLSLFIIFAPTRPQTKGERATHSHAHGLFCAARQFSSTLLTYANRCSRRVCPSIHPFASRRESCSRRTGSLWHTAGGFARERGKKRRTHRHTAFYKRSSRKNATALISKKPAPKNTPPGRSGRPAGPALWTASLRGTHNITTRGHSPKKFLFWLREIKMNTSS
jgi:hypothetical protein